MKLNISRLVELIGFVCLVTLLLPRPAYAYLDLGTGSFITQLVIAAVLGLGFAVRMFGKQIVTFFKLRQKDAEAEKQQNSQ